MKNKYLNKHLETKAFMSALFLGLILLGSISLNAQSYNLPITGPDAIRCGAGELTLTVEEVSGVVENFDANNVKWYTVPFYGTPIATGLTYNTGYIEFTQTYFVDYHGADGCSQCDRLMVRAVIEEQTITPNVIYSSETFCNSANSWFTPSVVGSNSGIFSISPGVGADNFEPSDGAFKPFGLTAGTYYVTYQPDAVTGCNSDAVIIALTVTDAPVSPTISYSDAAYCVDEGIVTITSQTGATGGSYSAVPSGLTINSSSGAITLASSVEGNYTVSYIVPAGGGCSSVSATTLIRIDALSVGGNALAESSLISSGTGTTISLANYLGSIQWQISTDNDSFADIIDETLNTLATGNLTSTTYYRAVVTNGVCGYEYSTTAAVTVSAASVAGTATASPDEICSGSTSTLTLSGYTGNIQWQSDITGSFVDIPGATNANYTTEALSVISSESDRTVKYRAVITEGLSAPDISNEVSITVDRPSMAGIVSGDNEICVGTVAYFNVFDQLGTIQWQEGSSATDPDSFSDLTEGSDFAGVTTGTLTASTLTSGTHYFRAKVTYGVCEPTYSDVLTIVVDPDPVLGTISANYTELCVGGDIVLSMSGGSGTLEWEYKLPSASEAWIKSKSSDNPYTFNVAEVGTYQFRASVSNGLCTTVYTGAEDVIVVTSNAQPTWATNTVSSTAITYGESVTFSATVQNGMGGTVTWVRSTTSGDAGITVTSPDTPTAAGTYYYRPQYAASGYSCVLDDGTETTVTVGKKELTVINAEVTTKTYDGNTTATITGATLSGLVLGDSEDTDVYLDNDASGTFASTNVGTEISVSHSMSISGAKAGNYTLTQPTLTGAITQRPLTAESTIASRTYDGTVDAGSVTVGTISNLVVGEDLVITASAADYADKNVENGKSSTITYTTSDGETGLAANYSMATKSSSGNITARDLTLTDFTADNKLYDGTTTVTGDGFSDDRVSGDVLEFDYSVAFADANVANGIYVNYTSISISGGADQNNYSLVTSSGSTTANITPVTLTVTADDKLIGVGESLPTYSYTISGFVNNETTSVISGSVSFTDGSCSTAADGTCTITPASDSGDPLTASNYVFSYTNGTLYIKSVIVQSDSGDTNPTMGYSTLDDAFAAINHGTHTGEITVTIYVDLNGTDATLNQSGVSDGSGGTANYTSVTIVAATGVTVSGGIILGMQ